MDNCVVSLPLTSPPIASTVGGEVRAAVVVATSVQDPISAHVCAITSKLTTLSHGQDKDHGWRHSRVIGLGEDGRGVGWDVSDAIPTLVRKGYGVCDLVITPLLLVGATDRRVVASGNLCLP